MTSLSLPEAVARYAPDGSRVYVGNFGAQLFCVVRTATFGHCRSYSAASRTADGFRQWLRTEVLDHPEPA